METFELKPEHVKLLSGAYVSWGDCEYGAPAINCKRPYGNSDVEEDIITVLGWWPEGVDEEDDVFIESPEYRKLCIRAEQIHKETQIALQVILQHQSFEPGMFVREQPWYDWKRA